MTNAEIERVADSVEVFACTMTFDTGTAMATTLSVGTDADLVKASCAAKIQAGWRLHSCLETSGMIPLPVRRHIEEQK